MPPDRSAANGTPNPSAKPSEREPATERLEPEPEMPARRDGGRGALAHAEDERASRRVRVVPDHLPFDDVRSSPRAETERLSDRPRTITGPCPTSRPSGPVTEMPWPTGSAASDRRTTTTRGGVASTAPDAGEVPAARG